MSDNPLVVIGAGVLGACIALALQRDGHDVLLIDREGPAAGASFGNAGGVVNGSCAPTAMPGIAFDVLRMIGRPLTPFTVRLSYLPQALPWMLRFLNESRESRVYANGRALHDLSQFAADAWHELVAGTDLQPLLRPVGWLKVYRTEQAFAASAHSRYLMDSFSVPYEVLDAGDLQELEPGLAPEFARAIYQEDSLQVSDPGAMVRGMADLLVRRGGRFERCDVRRLELAGNTVELSDGSRTMTAARVVVATGAWSGRLSSQLGDRVPLDTERGYHAMLPTSNNRLLQRPVMHGDLSFVLSPMACGFRITSQVEFAGLQAAPDFRRIRSLLPVAERMLPGLDTRETSVWMGCRPSLPDSLPVLGFSPRSERVIYAFGHQHLGLTLGPASAQIVADLVAGRGPRIDLAPYRVDRF
jgi:D-amino-acid dehydrogenase